MLRFTLSLNLRILLTAILLFSVLLIGFIYINTSRFRLESLRSPCVSLCLFMRGHITPNILTITLLSQGDRHCFFSSFLLYLSLIPLSTNEKPSVLLTNPGSLLLETYNSRP